MFGSMGKHVLVITVPGLELTASPWREVEYLVEKSQEYGFKILLLTMNSISEEVCSMLRSFDIDIFQVEFRPRGHLLRQRRLFKIVKRFFLAVVAYRKITRKYSVSVHVSLDYASHPFEAVLPLISGVPFVFFQRNLLEKGSRLGLFLKSIFAKRIFSISASTRLLLESLPVKKSKIIDINYGVDVCTSKYFWRGASSSVVLSVGHISSRKRYGFALEVFSIVAKRVPSAKYIVLGKVLEKDYYHSLIRKVSELGLEGKVEFLGARTDVLDFMSTSSVFMHCAISEALGWVLLEAMAVGTPVVSSNYAAAMQIIENGKDGFLLDAFDRNAFAEKVIELLENRELAEFLSINSREKIAASFSTDAFAATFFQELKKMIR